MTENTFLRKMKRRLAQIAIGPSALRNQGAEKVVEIARDYVEKSINYSDFFNALKDQKRFNKYLDKHTELLKDKFPAEGKSWGAARKAINLYLRESVYNNFIADHYNLSSDFAKFNHAIRFLEIPLDRSVSIGIVSDFTGQLPKWTTIKNLTPEVSAAYQIGAKIIAETQKIARVHLDLIYWRK